MRDFELHYTKLTGARNLVTFATLELLNAALAKAKAKNPEHDMKEEIFTPEQAEARYQAEMNKLAPVTFSERMAVRRMRKMSPATATLHGY